MLTPWFDHDVSTMPCRSSLSPPPPTDDIIAFTWTQYLLHPDRPEWIVFLPMARGCSRAMDAVTAFVKESLGPPYTLGSWLTYGASKRGWTTWWTGVTDSRVKMIAPLVFDLLNFLPVSSM